MAAILRDSVVVVVVVAVVRTRPRAIPLAMITTKYQFMGFLFFPIWVWGSAWWPFGPPELRYEYIEFLTNLYKERAFLWDVAHENYVSREKKKWLIVKSM